LSCLFSAGGHDGRTAELYVCAEAGCDGTQRAEMGTAGSQAGSVAFPVSLRKLS
jgi:hypothetical protein